MVVMTLIEQLNLCKVKEIVDLPNNAISQLHLIDQEIADRRRKGHEIFPSREKILLSLEMLNGIPPLVIVGQDPYPNRKATGISFQTAGNAHSGSLDFFARELSLKEGWYPNIGRWVSRYNVLMFNAALCNFGHCGDDELFALWRDFVVAVLGQVKLLNPNAIVMLLGKEHVHDLMQDGDRIFKFGHPAFGRGPTKDEWNQVESLLHKSGILMRFSECPVRKMNLNHKDG